MSTFDDLLDMSYNDTDSFDDFDYLQTRDYEAELQDLQENFDAEFNKYTNKRHRKLTEEVEDCEYEIANPLLEMRNTKHSSKKLNQESVKRFQKTLSSQSEKIRRIEAFLTKN